MPIYLYQCEECEVEQKILHGIEENVKICPLCQSLKFKRVFISPGMKNNELLENKKEVGKLTIEHIEQSRKDLEEMKEKMRNGEFK